jgi:hypothetical protein
VLRFRRQLNDGRTGLTLAPTELLRRLAAMVPPPRAHLVRFHGFSGRRRSWREAAVAGAAATSHEAPGEPTTAALPAGSDAATLPEQEPSKARRPDAQIPWATWLQRIFKEDLLAWLCAGRRKVTVPIEERKTIEASLGHLGLPTTGPPVAPARG